MRTERKRYLLFKMHHDAGEISKSTLNDSLWRELRALFGESGIADTRLYLNEYDDEEQIGVLQCKASHLEKVIQAAVLIKSIEEIPVSFEPLKTSGTLKALLHR